MTPINAIATKKEKGFTLIELVMVIVILGILAAFALPRFADLGGDARDASIRGAAGAVKSASAITHSAWLANGNSPASVAVDGATIAMTTNGYPQADGQNVTNSSASTNGIVTAAQLSDEDYTLAANNGVLTVTLGQCSFTYTETNGAVSGITDSDTTAGC